ncbi:MAG: N-acetylmuramoyl-L-alanine amidase [Acidobacteria bacterium]|nr:N-acetylmuramoyl-L-alanine amidase [Acidobacteriota bacterium]
MAAKVSFAGSTRRPERSRAAYERAVVLQKQLEAKPLRSRTKAEYEDVIGEFHSVYWNDFAYPKAPVAAEAIGDLYAEMGRVFSNVAYFHAAIKAYRYVISQYPGSSMARGATLSLGKVYLANLHDPKQSAEVFRTLLKNDPNSPEASVAKKKLREIAHVLAEQEEEASENRPSTYAERQEKASNGSEKASLQQAPKGLVEVTDIHDWVGPNYTRVVIGAQAPVRFDVFRLSHPDRIVFDLPNTRVNQTLLRKDFSTEGHFLQGIRVGQFKPTVTRVVLQVKNLENYSVFPLPNPFRLIIDIHGSPARVVQKAPKQRPPSQEAKTPSRPQIQTSAHLRSPLPAAKPVYLSEAKPDAETVRQTRPEEKAKTNLASMPPPSPARLEELPISRKPAKPQEYDTQTLTRVLGLKVARIVIDPGHGGHDTGTIGPTGLEEKNVVLDIALRLRKLIETRTSAQVIMTRSTDKFVPLEERTAIANEKKADLFISIHANSSPDSHVRGIETYYLNFTTDPEALELAARENATSQASVHQLQSLIKKIALSDKVEESQQFARDVQKDLYRDMSRVSHGIHNRGVKKAPFVVLIGANMPSILVEVSFLSNPLSEHLLREASYRQEIAEGIFQGIEKYMDNLGTIRVAQRTR